MNIDCHITFLYVDDLRKSTQFYGEILGLEIVLDQGTCRIFKICENSYIGICEQKNGSRTASNVIITIVTQEVDEWYEALSNNGITFEKPPTYNEYYKIYHCWFRDPDGYLIEIQNFHDPRWS